MTIKNTISETRVPVKIWTDEIEDAAKNQLKNVANLPFVHHHVAAMPDVHLGIGAAVGIFFSLGAQLVFSLGQLLQWSIPMVALLPTLIIMMCALLLLRRMRW